MPYYPKSQILTNLYTNGDEYVLSTNQEEYVGDYYELSNGKKYTGKNPTQKPNILLEPIPEGFLDQSGEESNLPSQVLTEVSSYQTESPVNTFLPQFNTPLPTKSDYVSGNFTRYFCKKTTELRYLEITQETYTKLIGKSNDILWSLYEPFKIPWKITENESFNYQSNLVNTQEVVRKLNLDRFEEALKISYSQYSPSLTPTDSTSSPSIRGNGGTSGGGVSGGGTSGGGGY